MKNKKIKKNNLPEWVKGLIKQYNLDIKSIKVSIDTPIRNIPEMFIDNRYHQASLEETGEISINIYARKKQSGRIK